MKHNAAIKTSWLVFSFGEALYAVQQKLDIYFHRVGSELQVSTQKKFRLLQKTFSIMICRPK